MPPLATFESAAAVSSSGVEASRVCPRKVHHAAERQRARAGERGVGARIDNRGVDRVAPGAFMAIVGDESVIVLPVRR